MPYRLAKFGIVPSMLATGASEMTTEAKARVKALYYIMQSMEVRSLKDLSMHEPFQT